jgi:hypothetical protein
VRFRQGKEYFRFGPVDATPQYTYLMKIGQAELFTGKFPLEIGKDFKPKLKICV